MVLPSLTSEDFLNTSFLFWFMILSPSSTVYSFEYLLAKSIFNDDSSLTSSIFGPDDLLWPIEEVFVVDLIVGNDCLSSGV